MFLSNLSGFKGTTCPPGQRSVRRYPPLRSAQDPQEDSPTFQGSIEGEYGSSRARDPRATRHQYTVGPDVAAIS